MKADKLQSGVNMALNKQFLPIPGANNFNVTCTSTKLI